MEGVARGLLNLFRELQNYVATAEAAAFKRRERAFGRLLFRGGALWETKCPRLLKIGYEFSRFLGSEISRNSKRFADFTNYILVILMVFEMDGNAQVSSAGEGNF